MGHVRQIVQGSGRYLEVFMTRVVLDLATVAEARRRVRAGDSAAAFADEKELPVRTVQHAVYGHTWRQCPEPPVDSGQKTLRRLKDREVRAILASDLASPALAERYVCADSTIRHIRTGRTWRHLSAPELERQETIP